MLDYVSPRVKYRETREEVRWRYRRYWYYLGQVLLFAMVGFWVGPNILLFRHLFGPSPADFAALAQQPRYMGIVASIKAYQRDFGALPFTVGEMPPAYLPKDYPHVDGADLLGTTRITFPVNNPSVVLVYEFAPASEGWYVYSPRYDGPVPAHIVFPSAATTQPATGPTAGGE